MRVVIDLETCTGCGLCASLCPDAFDMGDDGKPVARHKSVPEYLEDDYSIAAQSCPEEAIKTYT